MQADQRDNEPEFSAAAGESRLFAPGLWTLDGDPIRFLGFPYSQRMTIAKLSDGSVLLHSPVQLTPARRAFVENIGPVTAIVSPNKLHHLHIGGWAKAYPGARLFASPGLARRRRDLRFTATLTNTPDPAWADLFRQCVIPGSWFMEEVLFFHIPSATLIIGDLIENHHPALFSRWQRFVGHLNRMVAPNGQTPINYRLTFPSRRAARKGLQKVMAWHPEQIIVGHGPCVTEGSEAFLRQGFRWALEQR
jgi:hypothetical protein